ncbi:Translation machinery-associated protein 64 [Yarrowia sp. C11]|nr:Translation machinery-associated protein 64 [Yarrowia sp. E02]KAG5369531.1 Translation machinery-associated protein 64 [Yarrowia sp. C11]
MFQKKPTINPPNSVKSSQKSKLLQDLCVAHNLDYSRLSTLGKENLLPKNVRTCKFQAHTGEKGIMYIDLDGAPLWFTIRSAKDKTDLMIPTVFTLWKAPYLLPRIATWKPVLQKLMGGADLMLPGTVPPFPQDARKGSLVAVVDAENPSVPLGVGQCILPLFEIDVVRGRTGKAVLMDTVVEDEIFHLGKHEVQIPNDLTDALEVPYEEKQEVVEGADTGSTEATETTETTETTGTATPSETVKIEEDLNDRFSREGTPGPEEVKQISEQLEETKLEAESSAEPTESEPTQSEPEITTEDIDHAFKRALMQSLYKISKSPIDLPIPSSTFMSEYVLNNLPIYHPNVNIKKTSWKKASKFLKTMEKEKLMKVKEKGGDVSIISLAGADNEAVARFEPFKVAKKPADKKTDSSDTTSSTTLTVTQFWKPKSAAGDFFKAMGQPMSAYYQGSDLTKLLQEYIAKEKIADPKKPKNVIIDFTLRASLGGVGQQTSVPRANLTQMLQLNCQPFHTVTKDGEEPTSVSLQKGLPPTILVTQEKRNRNKMATVITGLEHFRIDMYSLADDLKIACAGSATITPIKEGSPEMEVMVQGPQYDNVVNLLVKRGVKPQWIQKKDGKGKPKKK